MRIVECESIAGPSGTSNELVLLRAEDGSLGLGEALRPNAPIALPLPWEIDLAKNAREQVARLLAPLAGQAGPAFVFAVETALFDLVGKKLGKSVGALLAPARPAKSIPINALLADTNGKTWLSQADSALSRGIRTLKVKIGRRPFESERRDLALLRDAVGPNVALRADVNGAWSLEKAPGHLASLLPLGLEYIEQPVGASDLPRLTSSPVPLAADETVALPDGLDQILAAKNCRVVVLKPSRLGGLLTCLALAERAATHGLEVVVTHSFEGPVGLAACCELALSLPRAPFACGLDVYPSLTRWPAAPIHQLTSSHVVCGDWFGLGIDDAFATALRSRRALEGTR